MITEKYLKVNLLFINMVRQMIIYEEEKARINFIHIPSGSKIILRGSFLFPKDGLVYIEESGELIIEGKRNLLTSEEGWLGIFCLGYLYGENVVISNGKKEKGGLIYVPYSGEVELKNFTLEKGNARLGGGIYCEGKVNLKNGEIKYCNATWGGGIYSQNEKFSLEKTIIEACRSERVGGGVRINLSENAVFLGEIFKKCEFRDNFPEDIAYGDKRATNVNNLWILYRKPK